MPLTSPRTDWLEQLPKETFFRAADVPSPTRGATHAFLRRELSKPEHRRRIAKVAPNLYWKPGRRNSHTGSLALPDVERIGWALAGPHAGALDWYGAHLVGWSTQLPVAVAYGVPGEPRSRNPHPKVELRGRRNLSRRELTNLEATYIEAVIGFDRWVEFKWWHTDWWETALEITRTNLSHRAETGRGLPRPDVMRAVAEKERPQNGRRLFHERIESLLDVFEDFAPAARTTQ